LRVYNSIPDCERGFSKELPKGHNPDPVLGSQNLGLYLGVLGTIQANSGIASNQVEAGNREKWKVSL